MDTLNLLTKFERIGARLKVTDQTSRRLRTVDGSLLLDVRSDRGGEYFEVAQAEGTDTDVAVLDVQPDDRHLLLIVRENGEKRKFLCGHDERHWFVAAVPETAPVGTVRQAKEALKPSEVQDAQGRQGLRSRGTQPTEKFRLLAAGEWFFLPVPGMTVHESLVLRNEPIRRGSGGKPHWVEFCYRTGGETVHVCERHPNGVIEKEYRDILSRNPKATGWNWRMMMRNAGVFVKGTVRHADHKTIILRGWHRVLMNTENQSKAMRNVAFLD